MIWRMVGRHLHDDTDPQHPARVAERRRVEEMLRAAEEDRRRPKPPERETWRQRLKRWARL
jgi:hypothetical protein